MMIHTPEMGRQERLIQPEIILILKLSYLNPSPACCRRDIAIDQQFD
jgi:hypothetical protein